MLAGGRSSRMGQDKATLHWQGTPLLQHMQQLLHSAGAAQVVVSGHYPEANGIADEAPELGPLGGLASVAQTLPNGPLLIVPVDMPKLSPSLIATLAQHPSACMCFTNHMLPLRIELNSILREFLSRIAELSPRERSLHTLHTAMHGQCLPIPHAAAAQLHNLNTPAQWQEATA